MKKKVYIESSVVSYYTAKPSRDIVAAARQEITREYWPKVLKSYNCYISVLVVQEAEKGDAEAAKVRLDVISALPILRIDAEIEKLARGLIDEGVVPKKCPEDALHIALAAVNDMEYLLTWNFKHINNAQMKKRVAKVIEELGYECPVICSPDELAGE